MSHGALPTVATPGISASTALACGTGEPVAVGLLDELALPLAGQTALGFGVVEHF
jgi:hypothetical protein